MTNYERFTKAYLLHLLSNGYEKQNRLLSDFEAIFGFTPKTIYDYDEEEDGKFHEWLKAQLADVGIKFSSTT